MYTMQSLLPVSQADFTLILLHMVRSWVYTMQSFVPVSQAGFTLILLHMVRSWVYTMQALLPVSQAGLTLILLHGKELGVHYAVSPPSMPGRFYPHH